MATREQLIEDFADHKYATGEKFARLINSMKVVQEPVADPAASGTSLSFIDSIEQDKDGKITATKKTLDLSNAHELNPFKGWWKTGDTLPTSGFDGAYLYFKDTTQTPAVTTIYQWNGTTYADTGTVVDTSNVQTFGSGQQVNSVKIKDENGEESPSAQGVLSAEAGKRTADNMKVMQRGKLADPHVFVVDYYFNTSTYVCTAGDGKGVLIPIGEGDIFRIRPTGSLRFIFLSAVPVVGETLTPLTIVGTTQYISCGTQNVPYAQLQAPANAKYVLVNMPSGKTIDDGFDELFVNGFNYIGETLKELSYKTLVATKNRFLSKPCEGGDAIKELYLQGLDQSTNYHIELKCYPTAATPYWQLSILVGTEWICRLTVNGLSFKGLYELTPHNEGDPTGYVVVDGNLVDRMPNLLSSQAYIFNTGTDNYLIKESCENLDFSPTIRAYLEKSYAVCSTAAATAQKEISKDTYTFGERMLVKMDNVNTASEVTLKVNEKTAYPLYYNGSAASSENTWKAGEVLDIYFDGTNYQATSFIGGGSESVEDLNSVIGTGTLVNLADTLITSWTSYRNYLIDRGYADKEYSTRAANGNDTYFVSNVFSVERGTIIEFEGNGTTTISQGVVLIQNATTKEPLLMTDLLNDANAAIGVGSYRYIIPYDMSIQLCTKTPYNDVSYYKIYKSGIQADNERMRTDYPIAFADSDEYRDLMSQATKVDSYNGSNSELSTGWKDTQVTLLHYSDIHGDILRVKRILEFRKKYSTPDSVIDDIICTGDVCPSRFSDYVDFSTLNSDGYNRVLQVIGNHDVYDADGTHEGSGYDNQAYYATEQQKFERYMANASTWGVIRPSDIGVNNYYPCYYYKDYTANRTYGPDAGYDSLQDTYKQRVRLIVLDAMIKSTDTDNDNKQKKWFAETLLDAKTNGKHVVVADHFAPRTSFESTNHFNAGGFSCITDEWGGYVGNTGIGISNYAEIVDYYIKGGTCTIDGVSYDFGNGGGEFVCWLCGHFHWDMVGTTTTYPEQVFIAVGSASIKTPMQHRARVVGEESEDLFNIVSIDTFRKHIRVFRVGAKWDRYLEHAGTMCISYDNSGNNVPHLISHF